MVKTISKYGGLVFLVLVLVASFFALAPPRPVEAHSPLYWVGNAGAWTSTAHWATSSGGGGGHAEPTSTDSVIFDVNSFTLANQEVTFSSTINMGSMTWDAAAGADTPIFKFNGSSSADWNIYGSFTAEAGVVFDIKGYYGTLNLRFKTTGSTVAVNDATWTSTYSYPGNLFPDMTYIEVGGGGTLTMNENWNTGPLTVSTGTLALNGNTLTVNGVLTSTQTFTDTVIVRARPNANGGTGGTSGAATFNNLTFQHYWNKHDQFTLASGITVNGNMTFHGNSNTDRILIKSSAAPTQRTITAATVISDYADFQDIVGAGAGDWDLSSAGESSIDFGNNSGLTLTYPLAANRTLYWTGLDDGVGGSGSWMEAYNWSYGSGGAGSSGRALMPDSTDDVIVDGSSGFTVGNQSITWSGGDNYAIYCHSIDFTGSNAIAPAYLDGSGSGSFNNYLEIYGSTTFVTGMAVKHSTYHNTGLRFRGGGGNITWSGLDVSDMNKGIEINASGTFTMLDDWYIYGSNNFTNTAGTLNTNGKTIYINGAATFAGRGQTYYGLYSNQTGTLTITGSNNFTNLTRIGTASYTDGLKFGADQYITNLTLTGFNNYQRLQFGSTVAGTSRQCSVSGAVSVTNTDLSDSAKVGAGDPDISAGDNSDFGGNLGWIFDTGYYIYWVGNSGTWSDKTNHWSSTSGGLPGTARVPLVQDIAVFDANSFSIPGRTVAIDITNISGIDASAVTNTPTISKAGTIDIYGDVSIGTLVWTVTTTNFKGLDTTLNSSSTLTTNMYVLKNADFMSSLVLDGNISVAGTIYPQSGVFNHNGKSVTAQYYDSATTTYTRVIRLGSGTLTLNGTGAVTKLNMNATNLTFYCENSTIILTNSGASGQTFAPASQTYYNIQVAGAGAYILTINSVFTCNSLTFDRSVANKTISGNYLVTLGPSGLVLDPSAARTITITNTDFSMASGVIFGDYLVISGSSAAGGGTFFANTGGHSTDSGGNSGWIWTPPTAPTISTLDATDVTYLGERLNGQLLTAGSYVTFYCYFEYGPTVSYGFTSPETTKTVVGTFNQYLSPYKVYHYRAVVRFGLNDHAYGNDKVVNIAGGVGQAKAAIADPAQSAGTGLLTAAPPAIPRMYAEGHTGGLAGMGDVIDPALAKTNTPVEAFWYPIAFILALLLGFGAYGMTRSLLVQAIVSGVVMAAFCGGGVLGDGLLPFWTVLIFMIEALLIWLIQEKQNV